MDLQRNLERPQPSSPGDPLAVDELGYRGEIRAVGVGLTLTLEQAEPAKGTVRLATGSALPHGRH